MPMLPAETAGFTIAGKPIRSTDATSWSALPTAGPTTLHGAVESSASSNARFMSIFDVVTV